MEPRRTAEAGNDGGGARWAPPPRVPSETDAYAVFGALRRLRRLAGLRAAVFFAVDFFAERFLVERFFAVDFLAVRFFAVRFFAVDFFAVRFFAVDFLATRFLAAGLRLVAFRFAVDLFLAGDIGHPLSI